MRPEVSSVEPRWQSSEHEPDSRHSADRHQGHRDDGHLGSSREKPLLGVASPDYGLVGRWFGHYAARVGSATLQSPHAPAVPAELAIGWVAHYLIGIAYAGVLVAVGGDA